MKEFINDCIEVVGCLAVMALFILLAWLFLLATPPQSSAVNDLAGEVR